MRVHQLEPLSFAPNDLLAAVARARGCRTPEEVNVFLDPAPAIENAIDLLGGYPAARERIRRALAAGEEVLLFGDYDCDGITALVQGLDFFRAAGHGAVSWFVPDRLTQDYGLSQAAVEECVGRRRPRLLLALDCGTASHAPIAWMREREIDCIVLDHHAVAAEGPCLPALADLNPKAWDLPRRRRNRSPR